MSHSGPTYIQEPIAVARGVWGSSWSDLDTPKSYSEEEREEESEEDAMAGRQGNRPEWVEQSRNVPSLHARSWARCVQYTMSLNPHDNICHNCRFTGVHREGTEAPRGRHLTSR